MALTVVDLFQAVHIREHDRHVTGISFRSLAEGDDPLVHGVAVLHTGQHVRLVELLQLVDEEVVGDLGGDEKAGQVQGFPDVLGVLGVKVNRHDVSEKASVRNQRIQHQTFHPGGVHGTVPAEVLFPDEFHVVGVPDDQTEAARHGILPGFHQLVKVVIHELFFFKVQRRFRHFGLAQRGKLPPVFIHQKDAAVIRAADAADILDDALHDLSERLVLAQLDAGIEDLCGRLL